MQTFFLAIAYFIFAPILGAFLAGVDRKLTSRLQGRVGPPLWQPVFDVMKLLEKENLVVRRSQNFYIVYYLILVIFTGGLFFTGKDLLLVIFALTLASIFLVLAGYKASSPYSFIGAQRELLQIVAYEPAILLAAIGFYMAAGTFNVFGIAQAPKMLIGLLPGLFISFVYILAIKMRKSPFDLSTSHHAHQEIVKGITTEFSGQTLAMIEIAHWYETAFILGMVYLFFAKNVMVGIASALAVYIFMIFVDNAFARVKWQMALVSSWVIAFLLGAGNIVWLFFVGK